MANAYISRVYLLDVPLESDYKHTLYFNSESSQNSYFLSKKVMQFDNVSYQRKDYKMRIPVHIDSLYRCNYVAYQNTYYSNKWMYAFIKDMTYINEGVTEVQIETDVMQTWYFDYEVKPSLVEREHVTDDTVGLHTIEEGLETGEYVCSGEHTIEDGGFAYVIATTRNYDDFSRVAGKVYSGLYSGMKYYILWTAADIEAFIQKFDDGYGEDIQCIFIVPDSLIGYKQYDPENPIYALPESVGAVTCGTIDVSRPNKLDGYTPRNKKLLTYPYQYILADNSAGSSTTFRYEFFLGGNASFTVDGVICPGTSRILRPNAYKLTKDIPEGAGFSQVNQSLSLGKYPICNWNSDIYTNWLTQQSVNLNVAEARADLTILNGAINTTAGIFSTDAGGNIAGGITGIAGGILDHQAIKGKKYEHSFSPMQSKGNINCGDVLTSLYNNVPYLYKMSIREEYAKQIDEYFDMFGYKCNLVKVPNKAHRSRYWYTKTVDINIDGAIPMKELDAIKKIYNNGITFWRNANEIQNYSLSNGIAIID